MATQPNSGEPYINPGVEPNLLRSVITKTFATLEAFREE